MYEFSLVLASGSPYRAAILRDLGLDFTQVPANIDESPLKSEEPRQLAERLGREKALAVVETLDPNGKWVVIGSDQVCHHRGIAYGKPGNRKTAIAHLTTFSGDWVTYSSSLVLISSDGQTCSRVEDYECCFRTLYAKDIENYVDRDQPWDCAGAIRIEKSAALLMTTTRGRDINTLMGLPVMALRDALADIGHDIISFIKFS